MRGLWDAEEAGIGECLEIPLGNSLIYWTDIVFEKCPWKGLAIKFLFNSNHNFNVLDKNWWVPVENQTQGYNFSVKGLWNAEDAAIGECL